MCLLPVKQGANVIIGAITFHGIFCAMLYRELTTVTRRPAKNEDDEKLPQSVIFRNILAEKKRNRTTSVGSLDGTVITRDNQLVRVGGNLPLNLTATSLPKIEEATIEQLASDTNVSEILKRA